MGEGFADLPDALVRDLLNVALPTAEGVAASFAELASARPRFREMATTSGLILRKADLDVSRDPSVAAVDGSYQMHRLSALDLCACAAVAVEGTAKEELRHWPEPQHLMWVDCVPHSKNATNTLRGLMISMELELATLAPHDLVLLDGSFIVFVIYLNQGLTSLSQAPIALRAALEERWKTQDILGTFVRLLTSERSVAVPKYSGRNELAGLMDDPIAKTTDGKSLATMILEPGEYTRPLPIYHFQGDDEEYHLPANFASKHLIDHMNHAISQLRVVFFRPFGWSPALRLEIPSEIADSPNRMSMALHGIERQMFTSAVIEPYPLFLADRMVKSLGSGIEAVEHSIAQHVVAEGRNVEMTMLMLQNYRTDSGRA